jgi:hypothetical protein
MLIAIFLITHFCKDFQVNDIRNKNFISNFLNLILHYFQDMIVSHHFLQDIFCFQFSISDHFEIYYQKMISYL